MNRKQWISGVLAAVMGVSCLGGTSVSADTGVEAAGATEIVTQAAAYDYGMYLADHAESATAVPTVTVTAADADAGLQMQDGVAGTRLTADEKGANWHLSVPSDGLYQMELSYFALAGKGKSVILSMAVDGKCPFDEAARLEFFRIYQDSGLPKRDANDNDIRPAQVEVLRWNTAVARNRDGYYHAPYLFYLTAGEHTLSLASVQESCLIEKITLQAAPDLPDYKTYAAGATEAQPWQQTWEAEQTFEKSSSMLYFQFQG